MANVSFEQVEKVRDAALSQLKILGKRIDKNLNELVNNGQYDEASLKRKKLVQVVNRLNSIMAGIDIPGLEVAEAKITEATTMINQSATHAAEFSLYLSYIGAFLGIAQGIALSDSSQIMQGVNKMIALSKSEQGQVPTTEDDEG